MKIRNKLESVQQELQNIETEIEETQQNIDEEIKDKQESELRSKLELEIVESKNMLCDLTSEVANFRKNDPKRLDELKSSIQRVGKEVEKHTGIFMRLIQDNIFEIKKNMMENNPGMDSSEFNSFFGLSEDFDYIEY